MLKVSLSDNNVHPYPQAFLCVMIAICFLMIQYALTMYFVTMAARIKSYTKEFMA